MGERAVRLAGDYLASNHSDRRKSFPESGKRVVSAVVAKGSASSLDPINQRD
jgi:hypothetical protein